MFKREVFILLAWLGGFGLPACCFAQVSIPGLSGALQGAKAALHGASSSSRSSSSSSVPFGRPARGGGMSFLPAPVVVVSAPVSGVGSGRYRASVVCSPGVFSDSCLYSSSSSSFKKTKKVVPLFAESKEFFICSGSGSDLVCR